jgi:hypothetical protein
LLAPNRRVVLDRRQVAALAGVMHYLKTEDAKNRLLQECRVRSYSMVNRWSVYGRRTIMQLRYRTQRRISSNHMPLPFVKDSVLNKGPFPHRIKNLVITQNRLISQARIRKAQDNTNNM